MAKWSDSDTLISSSVREDSEGNLILNGGTVTINSSGGISSGLNADKLDGYEASDLLAAGTPATSCYDHPFADVSTPWKLLGSASFSGTETGTKVIGALPSAAKQLICCINPGAGTGLFIYTTTANDGSSCTLHIKCGKYVIFSATDLITFSGNGFTYVNKVDTQEYCYGWGFYVFTLFVDPSTRNIEFQRSCSSAATESVYHTVYCWYR